MQQQHAPLTLSQVETMLAWLARSPALMTPPDGVAAVEQLLEPVNPGAALAEQVLAHHHRDADQRLGKLFERLANALLAQQPHLEMVAQNLVIGTQRTLGEIDLLVRDTRDGALCHVEMTLKFYLGLDSSHWPGPNPADSLARKWQRLAEHQFPLAHKPAVRAMLADMGLGPIDRQYLLSRGRLFYPAGQSLPCPPQASADHARGNWFRVGALPAQDRWHLVPRQLWMIAESLLDNRTALLASTELFDYVQQRNRPQMVIHHGQHGSPETSFVVPDQGWPDGTG